MQDALPFILANMLALVNFAVLVLIIIGLQKMRVENAKRMERYESIDKTIADLQHDLDAKKSKIK